MEPSFKVGRPRMKNGATEVIERLLTMGDGSVLRLEASKVPADVAKGLYSVARKRGIRVQVSTRDKKWVYVKRRVEDRVEGVA